MKTAAIYARVSPDRQKEEQTTSSQTSALRAYAAEHDYLVPEGWVCEDEGWSGATLVRPGLERVRDLAAQGQVDTLLVYNPDRLSRKYAYQVLLLEEFARAGRASPAWVLRLPGTPSGAIRQGRPRALPVLARGVSVHARGL